MIIESNYGNELSLKFFITANKFAEDAETQSATMESGIPEGWMGLDCGPKTIALFTEVTRINICFPHKNLIYDFIIKPIHRVKTIVWNG